MPLPKLEANKYPVVIPSTNKTIEFRPFLVKEEKILMTAQESKDPSQIFNVMKDIINACTFNSVDANELTTYDLEYLFIQLRAKSVGETADIKIKCEECDEYNEVSINLLDAKVEFPKEKVDKKIQLSDTVGIIMRPITIGKSELLSKKTDDDADTLIHTVIASIDSIYDNNGVYQTDDTSEDDLKDFVESLSHSHLELIQKYLSAQPKLMLKVEFKCSKCGHNNIRILEGLESFF